MANHRVFRSGSDPNNNPEYLDGYDDEMVNAKQVMEALLAERQNDREAAEQVMELLLAEHQNNREVAERRELRQDILYSIVLCVMICTIWYLIRKGY